MEKRIEKARLSLRELETVTGGDEKKVVLRGDTWVCKGDGHPVRVTSNWGWPFN
jgi:hypothetical protein